MTQQSIFYVEEEAIADAEALLAREAFRETIPVYHYRGLLKRYRKLFRQVASLVKMGDRMQQKLNALNQRLTESEEKYRGIFENAMEGIYRAAPDGSLTAANPALAHSLGYERTEELIREVRSIAGGPFLDPSRLKEFRQRLLSHGSTDCFQAQMVRKDGRTIWVEISARAVSEAGRVARIEGLVADVTERFLLQEELRQLATTDGLTGLANRRYFMDSARREFSRARRQEYALSLILLDIDHFKRVNDTYGHDAGDEVLKALAEAGGGIIREHDLFCRFGGEEFAVLLPGTDLEGATALAERLRTRLGRIVAAVGGQCIQFTISAGVSTLADDPDTLEQLIKRADLALYDAKRGGRNRIRSTLPLSSENPPPAGVPCDG